MRKAILIISFLILFSFAGYSQALESVKVVIVNDSIYQMGLTNGRMQGLIPAPVVGRSIIVQSIDVRNKVLDRLYSPTGGTANYQIGYLNGSYWYDVASVSFDDINAKGNTTYFNNVVITSRLFEESQTDNAPLMIKFDRPLNFTAGSNRLTLYITYRILN
jgi:hypothetical protein